MNTDLKGHFLNLYMIALSDNNFDEKELETGKAIDRTSFYIKVGIFNFMAFLTLWSIISLWLSNPGYLKDYFRQELVNAADIGGAQEDLEI